MSEKENKDLKKPSRKTEGTTPKPPNRYARLMDHLFHAHYRSGDQTVSFERDELVGVARDLDIVLPKNLGDVIYSFRYRAALPETIRSHAPEGKVWIIRPVGRSQYQFALVEDAPIVPNPHMAETKVPDSTPGVVLMYSGSDEQALLAKLRYNSLIDIFTGVTSYSLQNHLRTTVPGMGQVETDEIYIGIDRRGVHRLNETPLLAAGRETHAACSGVPESAILTP